MGVYYAEKNHEIRRKSRGLTYGYGKILKPGVNVRREIMSRRHRSALHNTQITALLSDNFQIIKSALQHTTYLDMHVRLADPRIRDVSVISSSQPPIASLGLSNQHGYQYY